MMDYEVERCTRHCVVSGRELQPGETFYSTLTPQGGRVVRQDYAAEAWSGPPEGAMGWWKSQLPARDARKLTWALELLETTADDPAQIDFRYVLSLLLARRRVLRLEENEQDPAGQQLSTFFCPRNGKVYSIAAANPDRDRARELQQQLAELLVAGG